MLLYFNLLNQMLNLKEPLIGEMGAMTFGGILGYSAGYAVKKIFKIILIVVGLLFVVFQLLAHYDMVILNWTKIQLIMDSTDKNNVNNFTAILTAHLPMSGGFLAGLVLGFKKG